MTANAKPVPMLFVYGTLRDPDILSLLLGRIPEAGECEAASAPGYRTVCYPGRTYPALLATRGGRAAGLALTRLTALDLAVIDAFEGNEYRRGPIEVETAAGRKRAEAYLPVAPLAPDAPAWTLQAWERAHKQAMFAGEMANAARLRAQLAGNEC